MDIRGRGNSLWRAACPMLWSNPIVVTLFHEDCPLCTIPCPKTQEHQSTCVDSWVHRVPENGHQPLGRGNSLWRAACPILWSNPLLLRYFTEIVPSVLSCPKTQEHQSTCVDSWVHRVPENGHQPLGRGNSLWRSACPILWSNPSLLRYFTEDCSPLCSLALRLRNTKVPVWTHESIGYPKMDISHWDAAIHYGYWWSNPIVLRYFTLPLLPCPKTQEHQSTRKWTSAIGTRQFTMAFSLPNIVIKPFVVTLFHGDCPLCAPLPYDSGTPKYLCGLMSP